MLNRLLIVATKGFKIAMNTVNSPLTGLTCGITVRDIGLCTVPVVILFASILTLL